MTTPSIVIGSDGLIMYHIDVGFFNCLNKIMLFEMSVSPDMKGLCNWPEVLQVDFPPGYPMYSHGLSVIINMNVFESGSGE